jgi:hypothetical protein
VSSDTAPEVYRLLEESKRAAGPPAAGAVDTMPRGLGAT